ncbi:hypothetical protein EXIGLDRAFT_736741 [Exidia glandulosa HHB12029]|uniref:Sphingolipid long chain base-responsive protein LSP1 n=1 Tax=Exidia glandulosa HHB12029 TaxID=1314781 RepID=A0A165PDF6_EXIGL|nr:hypothetical protein EXIGLDRAFT_736741 [Exidia glandulosa HHB12029]
MSRFFNQLADKAQSAINASPLAGHLPPSVTNALNSQTTGSQQQPSVQTGGAPVGSPAGGSGRHYAIENLQHSFKKMQVQYGHQTEDVKQLQMIVTAQKGVALDHQAVARDTKGLSKELFNWGQKEKDDVKDVTDRLAWINFVHGGLSATLGQALEASRAPLKAVRDAEENLFPRRNTRKGVHLQIQQIKTESKSSQAERKIAELTAQLKKLEAEDEAAERELEILKRSALREMEAKKWAALREYSEKVLLLSQASELLLAELPSVPPHQGMPYNGTLKTASVRAALQRALDNYKTGHINLPAHDNNAADSDVRSFGETHASELSSIASASTVSFASGPPATVTPPAGTASTAPSAFPTSMAPVAAVGRSTSGQSQSSQSPLDPATLNNAPAPIPGSEPPVTDPTPSTAAPPAVTSPVPTGPTVAETGVPLAAGVGGPGPASGSLAHGRVTESPQATLDTTTAPSTGVSAVGVGSSSTYESAEDEKKRLEREERERVLRGGAQQSFTDGDAFPEASRTKEEDAGGPPPYQPY